MTPQLRLLVFAWGKVEFRGSMAESGSRGNFRESSKDRAARCGTSVEEKVAWRGDRGGRQGLQPRAVLCVPGGGGVPVRRRHWPGCGQAGRAAA